MCAHFNQEGKEKQEIKTVLAGTDLICSVKVHARQMLRIFRKQKQIKNYFFSISNEISHDNTPMVLLVAE